MSQGIFETIARIGDQRYTESTTVDTNHHSHTAVSVPAAKVGSLTTRASNTAGTLTMSTGHGIATSAVADIYWSGGRRLGVEVGTVSGNSVPFSGGTGDNLPVANTSINVSVITVLNISIPVANIEAVAMSASGRGTIQVKGSDDPLMTQEFAAAGVYQWHESSGVTNPFDGAGGTAVESLKLSNGETTANRMRVSFLYD